MKPNYSNYSFDELNEALQTIDREAHPERVQRILSEIELKKPERILDPPSDVSEKEYFGTNKQIILVFVSVVAFFGGIIAIVDGSFDYKHTTFTRENEPVTFYLLLLFCFGFSLWGLIYSITQRVKNVKDT